MFDVLYNSYTGLVYCTATRDEKTKCDIKSWARAHVDCNSGRALYLPGSKKFNLSVPYKCSDCTLDNWTGCCKVITYDEDYDASGFINNYRIDVENNYQLVKTHTPSVRFYSIDNNEEYVYNEDYKAYLFKGNTKAIITLNKNNDCVDKSFDKKKIAFSITGGIAYNSIITINGIAENNILFSDNVTMGSIKIYGDGNGNSKEYIPTNILNVKYVYIKE